MNTSLSMSDIDSMKVSPGYLLAVVISRESKNLDIPASSHKYRLLLNGLISAALSTQPNLEYCMILYRLDLHSILSLSFIFFLYSSDCIIRSIEFFRL